jgi:hypothetical protein
MHAPNARAKPQFPSKLVLVEDAHLVGDHVRLLARTRIFALGMLFIIVTMLGYVGLSAYRVFSDSFVTPLMLSPDNDLVIASKLKLDELAHERAQAAAELLEIDSELAADQESLRQLRAFQSKLQHEGDWLSDMNAHKTRVGMADLHALDEQSRIARSMLDEQQKLTRKAETDLNAGLITRMDHARELQHLHDLQRTLLDHQRSVLQGRSNIQEISMNAQGLKGTGAAALGPQRLASEEQLTRVGVEIIRLESNTRGKAARRSAHLERFGQIDQLVQDLEARPVFKAIQHKLELAFVPYSQIDGVAANASVYKCHWGMFLCKRVGRVSEILEGEVNQTDPWGTPTRGQYAVLSLFDHDAGRSKTLRVRMSSLPSTAVAAAQTP